MENFQKLLVQERLNLAKRILEHGENLRNSDLIQVQEIGWTHPYIQHDALVNYLLLTCFDLLGQNSEWLSFGDWLKASKKADEREEVTAQVISSSQPIEITQEVYAAYQKLYGVKTSFYQFIDKVLTPELRERLLLSVSIEKKIENGRSVFINDPNKKKNFLYDSRNSFTHGLIPTGSNVRGLWPEPIIVENNKLMWGYNHVRTEKNYSYSVRRWPFELFEIISKTIGQEIEIYDFNLECSLIFEPEAYSCNVQFSELRYPGKLRFFIGDK